MLRTVKIFILISAFVFTSVGLASLSPAAKPDVRAKLIEKSKQLGTELQQFKNREKNVAKDKKESFQALVKELDSRWTEVDKSVSALKAHPRKKDQEVAQAKITALEKQLDKAESAFDEKEFGLGGLLGF